MLAVIPVSQADKHLIPQFLRAMELFPPGEGHSVLIVGQQDVQREMGELAENLSRFFSEGTIHIAPDCDLGYPIAASMLFKAAAVKVSEINHFEKGWLWMELDSMPLQAGFLTTIENAYYLDTQVAVKENRKFHRFMGVRERTRQGYGGELMAEEEAGTHMAPVGVYPGDLVQTVPVINSLGGNARPFYHHIQWYVWKDLNETRLIQNNKSTRNYILDGEGGARSESVSRDPWGHHWNNPLCLHGRKDYDPVLVHGVKDDSLLNILSKNSQPILTHKLDAAFPLAAAKEELQMHIPAITITDGFPGTPDAILSEAPKDSLASQKIAHPEEDELIPFPDVEPEPKKVKLPIPQRGQKGTKPKAKLEISEEERKRRSEHMKNLHAQRKAKQEAATA